MRRLRRFLRENGLQHGDDRGPLLRRDMGERVAQPVHATALLGCVEDLGCSGAQALVIVGDDELYAAQAAISEPTQKALPEGLGLQGRWRRPRKIWPLSKPAGGNA